MAQTLFARWSNRKGRIARPIQWMARVVVSLKEAYGESFASQGVEVELFVDPYGPVRLSIGHLVNFLPSILFETAEWQRHQNGVGMLLDCWIHLPQSCNSCRRPTCFRAGRPRMLNQGTTRFTVSGPQIISLGCTEVSKCVSRYLLQDPDFSQPSASRVLLIPAPRCSRFGVEPLPAVPTTVDSGWSSSHAHRKPLSGGHVLSSP
jgi:hypothetical protein